MTEKNGWWVGTHGCSQSPDQYAKAETYVDHDQAFADFVDSFNDFIVGTLLKNINMPQGLDIAFGPFNKGATLVRLSYGGTIDIGVFLGSPNGFKVGKFKIPFTMKGVTEYINEVWIPKQSKKVGSILKRKDTTNELREALNDFSTMVINADKLNPFLKSCVRGWRASSKDHMKEYYFICSKSTKAIIKDFSELSYYKVLGTSRWAQDDKMKNGRKIDILWVLFNKTRNMVQIGYFKPYTGKNYQGNEYLDHTTDFSPWVAPKNVMKYLDRMASKHPTLANLLANPNIKS